MGMDMGYNAGLTGCRCPPGTRLGYVYADGILGMTSSLLHPPQSPCLC